MICFCLYKNTLKVMLQKYKFNAENNEKTAAVILSEQPDYSFQA